MKRNILFILCAAAAIGLGIFLYLPTLVDKQLNRSALLPPYQANAQAKALHDKLFIADLHDDALLWPRDLLRRYDYGHTDLPRLREGRVSLQVFATVTKTPKGMNFESNAGDTDNITALAMAQRWPTRTWGSLLERALYQSEKLHRAAAGSDGNMLIIKNQADLASAFKNANPSAGKLAALLATEGLHPLEGKLENIDKLYEAGFRMTGLTHFFDNEVGGSAHGLNKGGLTPFGRQVIQRLEARKIIVDLAHASPQLINDVLAMAKRPVVVSHTGVQGTCPGPRNLSDAHIRAIAAGGGVIGIGYFDGAVCGLKASHIVRAIRHAVGLVGVKHVALGSDFDGATSAAFDTTGLVLITQGLLEAGFNEADIADLMGGNVLRLLQTQLPPA